MRLIDADELKRAFCRHCFTDCLGYCDDIQIIDEQPIVYAEVCGENHCPLCGAKEEEE